MTTWVITQFFFTPYPLKLDEEEDKGMKDEIWTMYFDGAQSQLGNGELELFSSLPCKRL
jgi:hypothetical protein